MCRSKPDPIDRPVETRSPRTPALPLLFLLSLLFLPATPSISRPSDPGIRPPAVAGSFYPDDPEMLRRAIRFYMDDAVAGSGGGALVLIAPHAGYIYSGQIAADAYKQAAEGEWKTVVILGTNHTVPRFRGVSIWHDGAYRTPLGDAPVDVPLARLLMEADGRFLFRRDGHEKEHSVEVQVPFVQLLFPEAKILPLVIGSDDPGLCRDLGRAIVEATAGRRVLIVASSDLSHYPSFDDAWKTDRRLLRAIAGGDPEEMRRVIADEIGRGAPGLSTCACGSGPILAAPAVAERAGARKGRVVSYANSGDTAIGDRERVVGYGAVAFERGSGEPDLSGLERPAPFFREGSLTDREREYLIDHARRTVAWYLTSRTAPLARPSAGRLWAKQGVFVTLEMNHRLRGCIGHMAEDRPLCQVVGAMALQAAFNDRRFRPLTPDEFGAIDFEISVLTPRRKIGGADEIVIGRHGVVLEKGGRSAVYLPQVAPEQGWNREETLSHLCEKAGLAGDCWRKNASFSVFEAEVFGEEETH